MLSKKCKKLPPGASLDLDVLPTLNAFCKLNKCMLRWSRLRLDIIETFKIINSVVSVNPDDFFVFHRSRNLRWHPFTITKSQVLTPILQQSFE